MRSLLLSLALCFITVLTSYSQSTIGPAADGWHDLHLGISSVDDAIKQLGRPAKDEVNKGLEILSPRGADWLSFTKDQKIFRKLTFEKPELFRKAKLYFFESKLAVIQLDAHYEFEDGWLDPDDLDKIVDVKFLPHNSVFGGKPLGTPVEFVANGDPTVSKRIAAYYEMIGITAKSFVFANVNNTEPIAIGLFGRNPLYKSEAKAKKNRDSGGKFPGYVTELLIVDRGLSKK
jgi:hypothetical protein